MKSMLLIMIFFFMMIIKNKNNLLMCLLMLEGLMFTMIILMSLNFLYQLSSYLSLITFLYSMVIEACSGLALLVKISRKTGKDCFIFHNLI